MMSAPRPSSGCAKAFRIYPCLRFRRSGPPIPPARATPSGRPLHFQRRAIWERSRTPCGSFCEPRARSPRVQRERIAHEIARDKVTRNAAEGSAYRAVSHTPDKEKVQRDVKVRISVKELEKMAVERVGKAAELREPGAGQAVEDPLTF